MRKSHEPADSSNRLIETTSTIKSKVKMRQIKLLNLRIKNFKGLKSFEFSPNRDHCAIYGRNGLGKTSVSDAMHWLLFDKDSHGAKDFGFKPTDNEGNALHNLEHIVEGKFELSPHRSIILKKVLTEKWTKKRGQSEQEFSGHETAFFIDEVPKSKQEYDLIIRGICDTEELFRLLTSTTFFNALKWQDQRRIVLGVSGDIGDSEVISAHPKLSGLSETLQERSLEDHLKTLKAQRPKVNSEIEKIGPRIAEAGRDKPSEVSTIPPAGNYADLKSGLQSLQNQRAAMLAGDTSEISAKIIKIREEISKANSEFNIKKFSRHDEIEEWQRVADARNRDIERLKDKLNRKEFTKIGLEEAIAILKREWYAEHNKPFPVEVCNMGMPASDHPGYDEKSALKKFNASKAEAEKAINEKGVSKSKELAGIIAEQNEINEKIKSLADELLLAKETADAVKVPAEPDHAERLAEIEKLQQEISLQATPDTKKIDKEISETQAKIEAHDQAGRNLKRLNDIDARIRELEIEKKKHAALLEQIDKEIMLCENFTRAKVSMLTESVNAKFSPLSFNLFDIQINGGIAETCEAMLNGVVYSDLSRGQKAIAGLSIIKALSDHYGITCPVFCDDFEGVTLDAPTTEDGQYIFLLANKGYEELTVKKMEVVNE